VGLVLALTLPAAYGTPSFTIVPTFDSSITSDPNASTIEATINSAIAVYESLFSNPITVQIYFQEGPPLGESNTETNTVSYKTFYDDLVSDDANSAAIAGLNANGGDGNTNGGLNPVTGTNTIEMKSANQRALGINQAPDCQLTSGASFSLPWICGGTTGPAYDGIITLGTYATYPPLPYDTSHYSLFGTVEHEVDEVLGLGSALENVTSSSGTANAANDANFDDPMPEDLFRYSAVSGGVRTLSTNCANPSLAYFSYGPSTGAIEQFNNACNGGDFGDWDGNGTAQVQDAFATAGANPTLGPGELDALTAIGYNENTLPEPGTFALVGTALLGAGWLRRRVQSRKR
jgi:hypothetical protein